MQKIKNFFSEVNYEMKETDWPTAKELRKDSITIFSVVIFFTLFFLAADQIISFLLNIGM